jgi:hypothetical protein
MPPLDRPVRIGNGSGFYGDRLSALSELIEGGPLDVLTGDWLAELTMAILFRDKMKDPAQGGYARTFLKQLEGVLPAVLDRGVRVVSNAGGLAPEALARAVRELGAKLGRTVRVAVVRGDDVLDHLQAWRDAGDLRHLETGAPLSPADGMPMACNAYLGGQAIAAALAAGADVVITGRTTDAAAVLGPAAWAHGWAPDAFDALAGALVAGHIIECGTQATGGNYSRWREVPRLRHPGFPIAEIAADGSAVITKHPGTDGLVSVGTVTAQLLYEIGGPDYLSPDVIAAFDTVSLTADGPDRVRVSGTRGLPPTDRLKAGVLLAAGFRNEVQFLLGGADVPDRAAALGDAFWPSVGGASSFAETATYVLRGDHPEAPPALRLSRVVFAASDPDRDKVGKRFGQRAVELTLANVPGLTLAALPDDPKPIVAFWPTLVPRADVPVHADLDGAPLAVPEPPTAPLPGPRPAPPSPPGATPTGRTARVPLGALASARSGDKAGNANVGFWVDHPHQYAALAALITEDHLRAWLGFSGPVRIWPLPNLLAINVELVGWLGRGVAANLHPDSQAKCLAEGLRSVLVDVDESALTTP